MQTNAFPPGPSEGFDLSGSEESLLRLTDYFARFGDVYRVFAPARGVYNYVINHPDDIKRVLLSNHRNYTKGEGMDRVKILLGNGIMTSEGGFWRRQRRMMQPAFHRRVIDQFSALIAEVNEKYATRWAGHAARHEAVNISSDTSELTLEIVLRSIFGRDLVRLEQQMGVNPFEVVAKQSNRDLRFAFQFRSLAKLVGELIKRRRSEPDEHFDFLSMFMATRDRETDQPMADKELIDEVLTLIVAGHETTAAALTWTWYLLAGNPDTAAALHAEADRVPASGALRLDAAESLSLTHQVLQESLRLYPPGWLLTRRSLEADELGGFPIGPRTDVFISPYMLHRHPDFWDDPEVFRPERFAGADASDRHRFAYIPFAVGPRHCIGENIAMFEMLVHVHTMMQRFRLTRATHEPIEIEAQINLRPALQSHDDGGSPMKYSTLVDMLEHNRSLDRAVTYVEGENAERRVSYRDVHARALGILHHLQSAGAQRGDKMIIFLNNNEQFLDGFWAAVCGGIVPVPLAVGLSDEHRHKLLRVARKLGRPILYTDVKSLERLEILAAQVDEKALFQEIKARAFLVESITDISRPGKLFRPTPDDLAFIQFSSGSTSEPKGVMLSHGNLLANTDGTIKVGKFGEFDTALSWMPLTHDMGLIGFYLMLFYSGSHINLMPTELFVRRPLLWMQLIAKKRATISSSPNFGYRHFLKVLGNRKLESTDLSPLRLIYNGAEPISVPLCNEFMTALAYTGLRRSAMYPVYGLAEATLAVTLPAIDIDYRWLRVNRHRLKVGSVVDINPADARDALELMCVGQVIPNTEMLIADADRVGLPSDTVGHILIRGAAVTRGYYGDDEATKSVIDANGWLDTGDLGFLHESSLYVAGRSKEIIFVNGQNYYPYDLENIAQRAPGLDLNKVVAAGVAKPGAQGEELVVFALHRGTMEEFLPIALSVARLINEHTGLEVAQVIPTKRIPKTTSGKVQRHLLEQSYVEGEFDQDIVELDRLRASQVGAGQLAGDTLEARLQAICESALPGKRIDVTDNLFEIGASSLKLIEIHENIDRDFPNLIDLTELFDHPTIAQLAAHLSKKRAAEPAAVAQSPAH